MLRSVIASFGVLIALSQGPSVWAAAVEVPGVEAAELREHSMQLQALKDKLADYKKQYPHVPADYKERYPDVPEEDHAMGLAYDLFLSISSGGKFSDLTPDELKVTADAIAQLAAQRQTAEMLGQKYMPFPVLPYDNDNMVILNISLLEIIERFSGRSAKQCALKVYKESWSCEVDRSKNPELPKQYNEESDFDRFDHDVQSFLPYIDAYFKDLQTRSEADEKEGIVEDGAFYVVNKGGITTVCIQAPKWMNLNHLYFVVSKDGCMEPFGGFLVDTSSALVAFQQGGGVYRIIPDSDTGFKKERIIGEQETFADHWRPQSEEESKRYFWTDHLIPGSGGEATVLYTIDINGEVSRVARIPPVSQEDNPFIKKLQNSGYLVVDNSDDIWGVYNVQTGLEELRGKLFPGLDGGCMILNEESNMVTSIPERNGIVDMSGIKTYRLDKLLTSPEGDEGDDSAPDRLPEDEACESSEDAW